MKKDKDAYINDVCKAIEESRKTNKTTEVYESIRKITGKFTYPCDQYLGIYKEMQLSEDYFLLQLCNVGKISESQLIRHIEW